MIQVLTRAMKILELLGENPQRSFTLAEIVEKLSLDKGTCVNILKTLSSQGFVQQEAPRSGYKLGYRIYDLVGKSIDNEELTKIARKDVDSLGERLNETALVSIIRNDRRVILHSTIPEQDIFVRASVDKSIYKACTGRVIIANYSSSHLDKVLIRIGLPTKDEWPEIASDPQPAKALANAFSKIKRDGYVMHHDNNGIVGFASPIFKGDHVAGAVGVYLPENRLHDENLFVKEVKATAEEINKKISLYFEF